MVMTGDGRPHVFRDAPTPDTIMDPSKTPYPLPEVVPSPLRQRLTRDPLITGSVIVLYMITFLTVAGCIYIADLPGNTEGYKVVLVSLSGIALALLVLGTGSLLEGHPDWEAVASPFVLLATLVLFVFDEGFAEYMWFAIPMTIAALVIIVHFRVRNIEEGELRGMTLNR